jgi:hypothetical protein
MKWVYAGLWLGLGLGALALFAHGVIDGLRRIHRGKF